MMVRIFCLIMIFMAAIGPCYADMYTALKNVYDTNPVIAGGREMVNAAKSDLALARAEMKPYLGVGGNIGAARTKIGEQTFDTTPTEIGVQFQQNIFQGFSTVARIKAARGIVAAQTAELYSTQQDVFLQAINAYVNVLNAAQILKLNENNMRVLREYHDYVSQKQQVGILTKTDVAQSAARLENAKYRLSDARAQYDNSIETFRRIYGHTENEYSDINLSRMDKFFPASISSAEDAALKSHPALLALAARESAARENIVIARKSILPSVDVRASAMQFNDIPFVDKLRDGRVGLYASVPLYDRGTAHANVEKVRYTVAGIQDEIINTRRTIIEKLRMAWNTYDAQTSAISAAMAAIDANKLALDGIRAEQKRGRRTVLDVLNAEQELLNSRVALAGARHSKIVAYFAVLSAAGRLSPENLGIELSDAD